MSGSYIRPPSPGSTSHRLSQGVMEKRMSMADDSVRSLREGSERFKGGTTNTSTCAHERVSAIVCVFAMIDARVQPHSPAHAHKYA
jgi:hypothetical protein